MQQPSPQQRLTNLCIWWQQNRPRAKAWAEGCPTVNGATYQPQWVNSVQIWVDGWRGELRSGSPRVRLWGCYLREIEMLRSILGDE